MSFAEDMTSVKDTHYIYDGSLPGFYCCVYESVYSRSVPAIIESEGDAQPSLMQELYISTDMNKAKRVRASVSAKISARSLDLIETVFLSCLESKELKMLRYLLLGYEKGAIVDKMLGHPDVASLLAAERHLLGESHLLTGFIRFSEYDGVLAAVISPKNFVLPFLRKHFIERYNTESFIIYDKTHKFALLYQQGRSEIFKMDHIRLPEPSKKEQGYRELWKRFYKTIAIQARENPKCRMTHMPKRYWENMTEMAEYL